MIIFKCHNIQQNTYSLVANKYYDSEGDGLLLMMIYMLATTIGSICSISTKEQSRGDIT